MLELTLMPLKDLGCKMKSVSNDLVKQWPSNIAKRHIGC